MKFTYQLSPMKLRSALLVPTVCVQNEALFTIVLYSLTSCKLVSYFIYALHSRLLCVDFVLCSSRYCCGFVNVVVTDYVNYDYKVMLQFI